MRYLFVIQGEGRGHLTQALSLAAMLRRNGHEIVGALVGRSPQRRLPAFFVEKIGLRITEFEAPQFAFDRSNRSVCLLRTLLCNLSPERLAVFNRSRMLPDSVARTVAIDSVAVSARKPLLTIRPTGNIAVEDRKSVV